MGFIQNPPPPGDMQIAAATDYLMAILEAVKLAQAFIIRDNIRLVGTESQQAAFAANWSEIRGIAAIALAKATPDDNAKARVEANLALDRLILNNPEYDKFKIGTAAGDDPLTSQVPK